MIKFAFEHIGKHKVKYYIYVLEVIFIGIIQIFIPILSGRIVDIITTQQLTHSLIKLCIIWCGCELINILFEYLSNKIFIFLETQSSYSINRLVLKHLHQVSLKYLDTQDMVYLSSRIYNDSNSIISFALNIITDILSNGFFLVISVGVIWYIEKYIGWFLIILLTGYTIVYYVCQKLIYRMSFLNRESQDKFFSSLIEQLNNVRFIKSHEISDKQLKNLDQNFQLYFKEITKTNKFFYFYDSLDSAIISMGKIIIYLIGGYSVLTKRLSIGSFIIVLNYFQNILTSAKYFTELAKNYKESQVSYNRILELLQLKEKKEGRITFSELNEICCNQVSFYREDRHIINRFSQVFKKGYIYCFWGENGCGKTTLVDLLLGIYNNEFDGNISYNGIDIHNVDMKAAREKQISLTEQEPYLFTGSIKENVLLTDTHNPDLLYSALNELEFDDIKSMIQTNKIIIDDRRDLSGGEKQKLALLRMFSKDADVLILDEPTSALDDKSKNNLIKYIKKIHKEKIILIISHDKSVADNSDIIIKLGEKDV